jgi:hypothetical protein
VIATAPRSVYEIARTGKGRRLGVLAASTVSKRTHDGGRLFLQMEARPFRGPDSSRFFQHFLRQGSGTLRVIGDGAPIQRAQVVRDFLLGAPRRGGTSSSSPATCPNGNRPKGSGTVSGTANIAMDDLAERRRELQWTVKRLHHMRRVVWGGIAQCGDAACFYLQPKAESSNQLRRGSLIVHEDRLRIAVGRSSQTRAWTGWDTGRTSASHRLIAAAGIRQRVVAPSIHTPSSVPARSPRSTVSSVTCSRRIASRTFR